MAKNTSSSKFRKVDVDQFDEDRFKDDEDGEISGVDQGPNETEINNLLARDKCAEALQLVLQNAPANSKNQAVKDRAANLAVRVLTSFKGDMDQCIKSLDNKSIDTLMKYIYRGFETPTENSSAILLTWHQKTFAAGGLGSIMRVMTDRKRV
ncbi:actin-related protein 2/3 complex subunit 5-B-like [Physella acuta]|uniref:actin-related protein 2/3 complex subunit 5-B-like n=1 Tax=Physella acuta TaxID=109671 RepID=UPI0027DD575B|nr:actin-related protein 2/3 complex subunit 5-B-like [Physella acuta]